MPISSPKASQRQPSWTDVKTRLEALDRRGLVDLVHDLYEANTANRRFLQARLLPSPNAVEKYRKLVRRRSFRISSVNGACLFALAQWSRKSNVGLSVRCVVTGV